MTEATQKIKITRGMTPLLLCVALCFGLAGCASYRSDSWYDSDKNTSQKSASKNGGSGGGVWWRLRDKLDRRPEAVKAREAGKITKSGLIIIGKGDTYYSLSQQYEVPLRALLDANNAQPPYVLSPGDRVRLPQQAFYVVKRQDTLYSISRAHDTDVAKLAQLNGLRKPYTINVGQRLQIPGLTKSATQSASNTSTSRASRKPAAMPDAPKRVGRFLVPVKGKIISSFGPKEGGLHNDGINIAARAGTSIRAAENGVVVYTGNELRGYGNLLLIRHRGGWVTAYAHTSKFLVKPGAKVKQGDIIAEVGSSGNVERPQLHFELRKGTRAVNPQSLI